MTFQPPKPDAGSDLPRALRQHTREIATSLRSLATSLGERFSFRLSVAEFGAVGSGADESGPIQAAIDELASRVVSGQYGGGVLEFDAKRYRLNSGLTIPSSFITLEGQGPQATYLEFANGSSDCITVGTLATASRGQTIRRMCIAGSGKTGGFATVWRNAYNCLLDDVQVEATGGAVDCGPNMNNLTLRKLRATLTTIANPTAIKFWASSDGTTRADGLWLYDVVCAGAYTGDGLLWDGFAHTLGGDGLTLLKFNVPFRVTNSGASATYYPSFANLHNVALEGAAERAMKIEAGNDLKFSNCDITNSSGASGQGGADQEAIFIAADTAGSATRGVQFSTAKVGNNRTVGLRCDARDCAFSNITFQSVSLQGSGSHAAMRLGATAQNCSMVNIRAEEYGGAGYASYLLQLDAGATFNLGVNLDARFTVTGSILDNSGTTTNRLLNLVLRDGNVVHAAQDMLARGTSTGSFEHRVTNTSTGNAALARVTLETGISNSFFTLSLENNTGAPRVVADVGSGVTGAMLVRMPTTVSRTLASPLELRVTNGSTNGAAEARLVLETGVANAFFLVQTQNNAGTPRAVLSAGPGLTGGIVISGATEQAGNLNITTSGALRVNGTQVVTSRRTGWAAPTGTRSRATYDDATVTTQQLAQRLSALIDDLTTHGLIGT